MVTGLGGRLFVGIPRFVVSSSSKLALLSLPIPLFSGPMTKVRPLTLGSLFPSTSLNHARSRDKSLQF